MEEKAVRTGRCACGSVTFKVRAPKTYGACHCKMCRRWTGGIWMGVVCEEIVHISGPITRWNSSKIGSRGTCSTCGSSVWHKPIHTNNYTFGQGLFDDQEDWSISREIFSEKKPSHYSLSREDQKAFTGWGTLVALLFGRLPK